MFGRSREFKRTGTVSVCLRTERAFPERGAAALSALHADAAPLPPPDRRTQVLAMLGVPSRFIPRHTRTAQTGDTSRGFSVSLKGKENARDPLMTRSSDLISVLSRDAAFGLSLSLALSLSNQSLLLMLRERERERTTRDGLSNALCEHSYNSSNALFFYFSSYRNPRGDALQAVARANHARAGVSHRLMTGTRSVFSRLSTLPRTEECASGR